MCAWPEAQNAALYKAGSNVSSEGCIGLQEENFTEAVEASRRALAPIDIRTPFIYTGPTDAGPVEVIVHDATEVGLNISELTCISVSCSRPEPSQETGTLSGWVCNLTWV